MLQGDITDENFVLSVVEKVIIVIGRYVAEPHAAIKVRPDFVFHMAAQASRRHLILCLAASHGCFCAEPERRQRSSSEADL